MTIGKASRKESNQGTCDREHDGRDREQIRRPDLAHVVFRNVCPGNCPERTADGDEAVEALACSTVKRSVMKAQKMAVLKRLNTLTQT
jgi:hypothetical protein